VKVSAVLFEADGSTCYVEPASLIEVSELVGCSVEDLTPLHYGKAGVLWMARSRQTDKSAPENRNATMVVSRFHAIPVLLRGAVVSFPEGERFPVSTEA
jgi:hypothetical protein